MFAILKKLLPTTTSFYGEGTIEVYRTVLVSALCPVKIILPDPTISMFLGLRLKIRPAYR